VTDKKGANPWDVAATSNIPSRNSDAKPLDSGEGRMVDPTDVFDAPASFESAPHSGGEVFATSDVTRAERPKVKDLAPPPDKVVAAALAAHDPEERAPPVADDGDDFESFDSVHDGPSIPPSQEAAPDEESYDDLDEDFAVGPETSVSRLRPAYEPDRPKTSIEVTMPGIEVKSLELGESPDGEVFTERPLRRLAQRLQEKKREQEVQSRFKAGEWEDVDLDIDHAPEPPAEPPSEQAWTVNTQVTGRIDVDLTQEVWTGERLPHGQEHAVPKTDDHEIFEIERELADGKHGAVFLAHLPEVDQPVALKILNADLSHSLKERQRFRREIRSHAALAHPNIVQVLKYGRRQGRYFLATELMEGSLRDVIETMAPLPTAVAAFLLEDLLKGIQYAHLRQIIHRELKPSNLLFSDEGVLKISDFGFAKSGLDPNQSVPGVSLGSTAYMSPEQAIGDPLGPRSDLFAIGTLGYEMLAGKNPYDRGSDVDNMSAVRRADAHEVAFVRPDAHPHLSLVLAELGEAAQNDRPESAYEALKRLWPLARMVQKRYPKIRRQFVTSPQKIAVQLRKDEARLELQRGDRLLETGARATGAAFLAYYRSWALEPTKDAKRKLDDIAKDAGYKYDADWESHIQGRAAESTPADPFEWEERASVARKEGRIWDAWRYLRVFVRKRPLDHVARATLRQLYDEKPLSPYDRGKKRDEEMSAVPEVGSADREHLPGPTLKVDLPSRG
jgi:serine/threonine protein kinase